MGESATALVLSLQTKADLLCISLNTEPFTDKFHSQLGKLKQHYDHMNNYMCSGNCFTAVESSFLIWACSLPA